MVKKSLEGENAESQSNHWKIMEDFLQFFYWSFMKSQEQNKSKEKMLHHSLGTEIAWKISSTLFAEASWKV